MVETAKSHLDKNLIRLSTHTHAASYVKYIVGLFAEGAEQEVVISSLGNTIAKAVSVAEMVKHRVAGLHQVSSIATQHLGSHQTEGDRKVTALRIVLSKSAPAEKGPGYQTPLPLEEVRPELGPEDEFHPQQHS